MSTFKIKNTTSGVELWEGEHESAAESLAALEAVAGNPEEGWGDDVWITETWHDGRGELNSRRYLAREVDREAHEAEADEMVKAVTVELDRIGFKNCAAETNENEWRLVHLADGHVDVAYNGARLLELLKILRSNLADVYEDDEYPGHETRESKAYQSFWNHLTKAEVRR